MLNIPKGNNGTLNELWVFTTVQIKVLSNKNLDLLLEDSSVKYNYLPLQLHIA